MWPAQEDCDERVRLRETVRSDEASETREFWQTSPGRRVAIMGLAALPVRLASLLRNIVLNSSPSAA